MFRTENRAKEVRKQFPCVVQVKYVDRIFIRETLILGKNIDLLARYLAEGSR